MEAPAARITVLLPAHRTEGKLRHGGQGTVIGQTINNGEPWAAGGAGNKGMLVAMIIRIKKFPLAVGTHAEIGRSQRELVATGETWGNGKVWVLFCGNALLPDRDYDRPRWRGGQQRIDKEGDIVPITLKDKFHPSQTICHLATKTMLDGQTVKVGTESYPLNHTSD
jgi:hypothetical protein